MRAISQETENGEMGKMSDMMFARERAIFLKLTRRQRSVPATIMTKLAGVVIAIEDGCSCIELAHALNLIEIAHTLN